MIRESPLVDIEEVRVKVDEANVKRQHEGYPPVELRSIEGDAHSLPLVHANGLAALIDQEMSEKKVTSDVLDNSAARALFRGVLEEKE